ncbi:MAG: universal stress protein [Pseudomonadota bacterium]
MSQPILVPLDGSNDADAALEVAADIAAKSGAHLKLLHVGLRQPGARTALYEAAERSYEQAERSGGWTSDHLNWPRRLQILDHMGRMILDDGTTRAQERGATSVEAVIDWGEEGERILHHSKHPPVDMIVMGSRGSSALQGLFLGSVSHKVSHLAPCTCVTVHAAEDRFGLGTLERILVPFDGSDHAMKAVELACDLAQEFGAVVKIIHVPQPWHSPDHLRGIIDIDSLDAETRRALDQASAAESLAMGAGYAWPTIPEAALTEIGEAILNVARNAALDNGVMEVETELLYGDSAQCILKAAETDPADMIVMGMRGLGEVAGMLMGSVSYKVNHLAPCTCITVK